ncbi:MAG: 1-deoxy-D-xylulose-5-phosphate synthase [Desulfovermiculus sp.]|nr:1-deoxy-D-xylulose-5-phosphate synthase [Desulfovermiculus sp.]
MTDTQPSLLAQITDPAQIRDLQPLELDKLAEELRREIVSTVSRTGGHLAPSLGVVELTLSLLHTFDPAYDHIIWDVGHQSYAYKILTQGLETFQTLRQFQGISGFPRRGESPFDHFGVGHSSTSISAALGMAVARDLEQNSNKVVAVIGDGSMTAGLAYEGLNQAGDLDRDLVVVLNDNEMSISKNVGALSSFFSRTLADKRYLRFKEDIKAKLLQVPRIGQDLVTYARRSEESLKNLFTPGMLFEAFKFTYVGPINGHNLRQLTNVFDQVSKISGPILVHVVTVKGKGYTPAESNPTHYHGVGCFEPETGESPAKSRTPPGDYSTVFGETLCALARDDPKIVAISAAMPEGTGLKDFKVAYPDRFFDVGICEQHAVTFAAGLASQGFKPVVAIYSTFLQRAYDQIVHDVCLQNLPVTFCLDRGGLVGEDGPTHHGAFDLSYLRHVPNMSLMAPKDEPELQSMLALAMNHPGPIAVRYPRGVGPGHALLQQPEPTPLGRAETLKEGKDAVVLALGSRVYPALQAVHTVEEKTRAQIGLLNARFVKPLPIEDIQELIQGVSKLLVVEENALAGGFGSAVLEFLADENLMSGLEVKRLGLPDVFIGHGPCPTLRQEAGIDQAHIAQALEQLLGR